MNTHVKKVFVVLGATIALAGCSLTDSLTKKEQSSPIDSTTSITTPAQTETTPSTEMGSPSYKIESSTPAPTSSTTATSDDPADLQKDLDSVSIESDFGSLVE